MKQKNIANKNKATVLTVALFLFIVRSLEPIWYIHTVIPKFTFFLFFLF